MLNELSWYKENNVTLYKGLKVTHIDRKNCMVTADDGTTEEYSRLLIATGSDPFIIPVPGHDLKGVISFRDIHDVDSMIATAKLRKKQWLLVVDY